MQKEVKRFSPYVVLTILILISCLIVYFAFIFGNKFFIFQDIGIDTKQQYTLWYSSIAQKIKSGTFSFWNFQDGFGRNIVTEGLFDPFQILICLFGAAFGAASISYVLIYINILKILLAGLSMFYFLNCFSFSNSIKIIISYIYAFNGFMMVWGQHYSFGTIVVFLPLLFAAVEQTLSNKKRWIFISFMAAIIGLCNAYLCYMSLISAGVYLLIRLWQMEIGVKEKVKIFVIEFLSILLGLALSCISLLPNAYVLLNVSSRINNGTSLVSNVISGFTFYPKMFYKLFIYRMFSVNLPEGRMLGADPYYTLTNYYEAINFCCTNLLVILMIQYVFGLFKKGMPYKQRIIRLIILMLLAFAFFIPASAIIYNGMSSATQRWTFSIIPLLLLLAAKVLDEIIKTHKIYKLGLICYLFLAGAVYYKAYHTALGNAGSLSVIKVLKLDIIILCLAGICIAIVMFLFAKGKIKRKSFVVLLLILVSANVLSDSFVTVNIADTVKKDSSYTSDLYCQDVQDAISYIKENDSEFFRMEKDFYAFPSELEGLAQNYDGISTYNSILNKNTLLFVESVWPQLQFAIAHFSGIHVLHDHFKMSLVDVKYILSDDPQSKIDGFTKIQTFGNVTLLKNNTPVALGRLYTKSISEEEIKNGKYNFDNVLANAVILEGDQNLNITSSDLNMYMKKEKDKSLLQNFEKMDLASFKKEGNDSSLSSDFDAPYDGVLFIAVPYEGGWTAYIDGEKSEILKADYGFSALKITKGKHNIQMKYTLPWLKEGSVISGVALCILILLFVFQKVRTRRKK